MKKEFKKETLNNKKNQKVIKELEMCSKLLNKFFPDVVANDYEGEHLEEIVTSIRCLKSYVYNLKKCILKEPYRKNDNVDMSYLKMLDEYTNDLSEFSLYINSSLNSNIEDIKVAIDGFIDLYISFFNEFHNYDFFHDNKAKLKSFTYVDDYRIKKEECVNKIKEYNSKYYD